MTRLPQSDPSLLQASGGAEKKNLSGGLLALAVVSTLIASTCCVLPLVLVLVGITGAWMVNLTSLQPYTPIFTVLAIGALLGAGYFIFLKPAEACSYLDGAACNTTRRATKWIFAGCALFIVALLAFPLFAPYFY